MNISGLSNATGWAFGSALQLVAGGGAGSETNYGGLFASTISDTLVDFDQFDGSACILYLIIIL